MAKLHIRFIAAAMCMAVLVSSSASAQVFGTFSWQMQPFCNVVTMTLTQVPSGFTIDGFDEQCGAVKRASSIGMALINPDGTVGLEFTIVAPPAGKTVHVSASINPGTGSGTWTDSVGNSGTFVLAGAQPGLPVRPIPASGLGPATITAVEIAPAAITGSEIASNAVTAAKIGPSAVRAGHLGAIGGRSTTGAAVPPGEVGSAVANCLAGELVIGGGNSNFSDVVVVASRKIGNGWVVFGRNDSAGNRTVTAIAYCLAQ